MLFFPDTSNELLFAFGGLVVESHVELSFGVFGYHWEFLALSCTVDGGSCDGRSCVCRLSPDVEHLLCNVRCGNFVHKGFGFRG